VQPRRDESNSVPAEVLDERGLTDTRFAAHNRKAALTVEHIVEQSEVAISQSQRCAAQSVSSCHFGVHAISHWKPSGSAM
jgi:hypothetical protein